MPQLSLHSFLAATIIKKKSPMKSRRLDGVDWHSSLELMPSGLAAFLSLSLFSCLSTWVVTVSGWGDRVVSTGQDKLHYIYRLLLRFYYLSCLLWLETVHWCTVSDIFCLSVSFCFVFVLIYFILMVNIYLILMLS